MLLAAELIRVIVPSPLFPSCLQWGSEEFLARCGQTKATVVAREFGIGRSHFNWPSLVCSRTEIGNSRSVE